MFTVYVGLSAAVDITLSFLNLNCFRSDFVYFMNYRSAKGDDYHILFFFFTKVN